MFPGVKGLTSAIVCLAFAACGPSVRNTEQCTDDNGNPVTVNVQTDPLNCGGCDIVCGDNEMCMNGSCGSGSCSPGDTADCYDGLASTEGVGPCKGGTKTCTSSGIWGQCQGQVLPASEVCGNGVDDNCNGKVDEDEDADGDGYTTCGGDCCDSTECSDPKDVNPGAFDAPGNNFDDDCDGIVDNSVAVCDQGLASDSSNAMDFAKAIDLCQTTTMADKKWGVISAKFSYPDDTGSPKAESHAIRPKFGSGVNPQGGLSLAILSTGAAAATGDVKPAFKDFVSDVRGESSGMPMDFLIANGGKLPNAPGCPGSLDNTANDPVMLTLTIRVPSNAHSFHLSTNFYSAEFPEWTCTEFNDFFVVLLDSTYQGTPANPSDKNLAFYSPTSDPSKRYPVGVNLASGNTGLFQQCVNGTTGCSGTGGSISTCTSTSELAGTGFDKASPGECDANSLEGGGTGWLVTSGNVTPGEIMKLRIAIWDTSDGAWDSLALIDGFQWSVDSTQPGTVIFNKHPDLPKFGAIETAPVNASYVK